MSLHGQHVARDVVFGFELLALMEYVPPKEFEGPSKSNQSTTWSPPKDGGCT